MREINSLGVFGSHFRQIVKSARAETARAERYSVMRIGDGGKKSVVILFSADYSRKSENIPRRIVRMDSHIYPRFLAGGHYGFKEINEIFEKFLVSHSLVAF